jgi:hypothetical protein
LIRRTFHILVIAVLALNLMGAWAFASLTDCGMECCKPGEWAASGVASYEAPSCCDYDGVTCGFEAGAVDELFDEAICCFTGAQKVSSGFVLVSSASIFSPSPTLPVAPSARSAPPPLETPLYLSNAAFLC